MAAARGTILVVDDEPLKRITLQIELAEAGFQVLEAVDAVAARRILDSKRVDVVVSDVRMPGANGLDFLTQVRQVQPHAGIILMTAYASVENAVLAIKRGAFDYITKPFTTQDLLPRIERLLALRPENAEAGDAATAFESFGRVQTRNIGMKRLIEQARTAAILDSPVLIRGEAGTGKELLAEAIHAASPRGETPLFRLRCADVQPEEIEQQRGALEKPAVRGAPQWIGATLLLDEVDATPIDLQPELARLVAVCQMPFAGLEDGAVRPRVRLIALTRADLGQMVADGGFREELYQRLNVIALSVPPLRSRPDDTPLLARQFAAQHAAESGSGENELSPHALDELMRQPWPGNVRELDHTMQRAVAFAGGRKIEIEHVLPPGESRTQPAQLMRPEPEFLPMGLTETVADIERRLILMALRQCNGNQVRAAQRLGIPRTTLRDKMAKHGVPDRVT